MSKRIKGQLIDFFNKMPLSYKERRFVRGCRNSQKASCQLTLPQWRIIKQIHEKYSNMGREALMAKYCEDCGHVCHCRDICSSEIGVGMSDKTTKCGCEKCNCERAKNEIIT
jgi:hypothetical protein